MLVLEQERHPGSWSHLLVYRSGDWSQAELTGLLEIMKWNPNSQDRVVPASYVAFLTVSASRYFLA